MPPDAIYQFSADELPVLCRELADRDEGLGRLLTAYGEPPMWSRPPGFETLVQIILEQQVSLSSAAACYRRLQQATGAVRPETVLCLSDEALRAASVSRQKAGYLRALATAVADGALQLDALPSMSDETVVAALTAIKGIGRWTADVYLMMVLHRSDRFPLGDVALVQSLREQLYGGDKVPVETLEARAEDWRPYRTVAAYLLWHAYLQRRGRRYSTLVP